MRLCFGILLKTGVFSLPLITAYAALRPFLLLIPPARRLWVHKVWEETQLWQLAPSDSRVISYHVASCSADKAEGKKKEGGCSEWWHLSCQVTVTCKGPGSPEGGWTTAGPWEVVNKFLVYVCGLLMCVAFAHLLTCLYLNPWVFSFLPFLFFPSISLLIEQLEGLSYQLGLNCDKNPIPVPGLPRICSAGVTLPLQPLLLLPTADVLKSCIRVGVWSRLELILRDLPRFPQQFYELSRI